MYTTIASNNRDSLSQMLTRREMNQGLGMILQQGEEEERPRPQPEDTGTFQVFEHQTEKLTSRQATDAEGK